MDGGLGSWMDVDQQNPIAPKLFKSCLTKSLPPLSYLRNYQNPNKLSTQFRTACMDLFVNSATTVRERTATLIPCDLRNLVCFGLLPWRQLPWYPWLVCKYLQFSPFSLRLAVEQWVVVEEVGCGSNTESNTKDLSRLQVPD